MGGAASRRKGAIAFTVPGTPVSQGSPKIIRKGNGKASIAIDSPKLKAWRRLVTQCARGAIGGRAWVPVKSQTRTGAKRVLCCFDEPVVVWATFYFNPIQRPRWGDIVATRPDLDKLQRAIGDALEDADYFPDDSRIVGWPAVPAKRYGEARVEIAVQSYKDFGEMVG